MLLHVSEFHSILWLSIVPGYDVPHFVYPFFWVPEAQFKFVWRGHQFLRCQLGQFWHYLTRDRIRFHRLRVQSYRTAHFCHPHFRCQSKPQVVSCASHGLAICGVSHKPLLGLHVSVTGLSCYLYLWLTGYKSVSPRSFLKVQLIC